MTKMLSACLGLGVIAMLAPMLGCTHAWATRTGRLQPSLPAGCPVRFENLTDSEAKRAYERVGVVVLNREFGEVSPAWEGDTRKALWPKVCALGGNVVTPGLGAPGSTGFAVWRDAGATTAAPPPAAVGGTKL